MSYTCATLWYDKGVKWCCPECGKELVCRDHAATRLWRHLNPCHLKTYIEARIPRVNCPVHGVRQVNIPWAEYRSRFSVLMERMIIDVITECASLRGVCRLMDISWDEAWKVMEKAVQRGLERKGKIPSTHKSKCFGRSIETGPPAINDRTEFGHWEADTVLGKKK